MCFFFEINFKTQNVLMDTSTLEDFKVIDEINEDLSISEVNKNEADDDSDDVIHVQVKQECIEVEDDDDEISEKKQDIHPYAYLIKSFEYPKEQLDPSPVNKVKTFEETQCIIVNNREFFLNMIQELRKQTEISLQIYRIERINRISVISIGTIDKEYIVDCKKIESGLVLLTEIFINPKIVKVVFWLEHIIGPLHFNHHLYLVNVFDVRKAFMRIENRRGIDLTVLLRKTYHCKRGHMSQRNLSTRPFTHTDVGYLRTDVHYFLHLYHNARTTLLEDRKSYLALLEECRQSSMTFDIMSGDYTSLHSLSNVLKKYHDCEMQLLKRLDEWRTEKANLKCVTAENILTKNAIIRIVRALPDSGKFLRNLGEKSLSEQDINDILEIIRQIKEGYNVFRKIKEKVKKQPKKRKNSEKTSAPKKKLKKRKLADNSHVNFPDPSTFDLPRDKGRVRYFKAEPAENPATFIPKREQAFVLNNESKTKQSNYSEPQIHKFFP